MFVAYLVRLHDQTQADLVDQLFTSSEKRLARALLVLARFGKEGRSEEVIPDIKQGTLAEMISTTRSPVNFFIHFSGLKNLDNPGFRAFEAFGLLGLRLFAVYRPGSRSGAPRKRRSDKQINRLEGECWRCRPSSGGRVGR
jgi:hypothetical protein